VPRRNSACCHRWLGYASLALTTVHFRVKRHPECVTWARNTIDESPAHLAGHFYLVAALAMRPVAISVHLAACGSFGHRLTFGGPHKSAMQREAREICGCTHFLSSPIRSALGEEGAVRTYRITLRDRETQTVVGYYDGSWTTDRHRAVDLRKREVAEA